MPLCCLKLFDQNMNIWHFLIWMLYFLSDQPTPKRLKKGSEEKKRSDIEKHSLKVPCQCSKGCLSRINELHRIKIWTDFWDLPDYDCRRSFIYQQLERKPTKGHSEHTTRNNFVSYYFKDENGLRQSLQNFLLIYPGIRSWQFSNKIINAIDTAWITTCAAGCSWWKTWITLLRSQPYNTAHWKVQSSSSPLPKSTCS